MDIDNKKKNVRKKRPTGKRNRRSKSEAEGIAPVKNVFEESRQSSLQSGTGGRHVLKSLGIELNPATARQAVILSEVIGKPVSQRKRRW